MNITILCVGRLKEKYWTDAASEYSKRLGKYCTLRTDEIKESERDSSEEEGRVLLRRIKKDDYVTALSENGTELTSLELAEKINTLAASGMSRCIFVIGGSTGLSQEVLSRADDIVSFSKMTFPHQMIRVFLLEQLYRSFKILKNEKYHK